MNCPNCGNIVSQPSKHNPESPFLPIFCKTCQLVLMIDLKTNKVVYVETITDEERKPKIEMPELPLKSKVYINNKQHQMFLEQGVIEQKDHMYYRIRLISCEEKWNGTLMWVPYHWVCEIPKELC
jgi:endogenous inhibitor of DNA gyrase (YacG/DUF329 family)